MADHTYNPSTWWPIEETSYYFKAVGAPGLEPVTKKARQSTWKPAQHGKELSGTSS